MSDSSQPAAPAVGAPPFDSLIPEFWLGEGFRARHKKLTSASTVPHTPGQHTTDQSLARRDRTREWYAALCGATRWQRTVALLDFRGGPVGGYADLCYF